MRARPTRAGGSDVDPHQHRERQVGQQERQAWPVVARISHDRDVRVTGLPVPGGDQVGEDPPQLSGGDRGGIVTGGRGAASC